MRRSETQSLYKALPGQYLSYELSPSERARLSRDSAVIKIAFWNKKETSGNGIYPPKIANQVYSSMSDFVESKNSQVSIDKPLLQLVTSKTKTRVLFVEAKTSESEFDNNTTQIYGNINPKMFYCEKCGKIKILKDNDDIKNMFCHNRRMKQYTRVWVCGCGKSLPIDDFDIREGDRYFATDVNGVTGKDRHKRRLQRFCPDCKVQMTLENATDNKAFYPRTITTIKLFSNEDAKLCESEEGCQLILKKHRRELSEEDYKRERNRILQELERGSIEQGDGEESEDPITMLLTGLDRESGSEEEPADRKIVYKILEYDTLAEKKVTDLDEATKKAIRLNRIPSEEPVRELVRKMKIKDIYSVSDIEIISTAYGYTRKYQSPEVILNANDALKLCAFTEKNNPGVPIFYNIRNKTEGIVIDIDPKELYQHLKEKLQDKFRFRPLKEEAEIRNWFLDGNNIDPSLIKTFSSIEQDGTFRAQATREVYVTLHTISHMVIQSISKFSGIDKNSLTEMVFPNLCSILIYASTNQAIVLGAITSMFDKQINDLLESIYNDARSCSFDPVCINDDKSNGSCIACTLLSEVACEHFNKDLGRRFLYGYHNKGKDMKGFWEE